MVKAQDEVAAMPPEEKPTSPFSLVETRSELARDLTKAFKDIKSTGTVPNQRQKYHVRAKWKTFIP